MGLTQLADGVLGNVAREGEGTSEVRRVGSSVVQPEALMLAHLGGGLPGRLYNAAVQHLGDEGGRRRHCNTTKAAGSATLLRYGSTWISLRLWRNVDHMPCFLSRCGKF